MNMAYEDDFIKIINKLDQYAPEVWHRELEREGSVHGCLAYYLSINTGILSGLRSNL